MITALRVFRSCRWLVPAFFCVGLQAQVLVDLSPFAPTVSFFKGNGSVIDTGTNFDDPAPSIGASSATFNATYDNAGISLQLRKNGYIFGSPAVGQLAIEIFDGTNIGHLTHQIVIGNLFPADTNLRITGFDPISSASNALGYLGDAQYSTSVDPFAGTLTFTFTGGIIGSFNAGIGGVFTTSEVSAIPEPAAVALLLALGAGGAAWWRRRRREVENADEDASRLQASVPSDASR